MNTMIANPVKNANSESTWVLNHSHRCDVCHAQAYVEVTGNTGDLLFCAHHYNNIMNSSDGYIKMMAFANQVVDEREKLNMTRSVD
jgi:hypothetical protein